MTSSLLRIARSGSSSVRHALSVMAFEADRISTQSIPLPLSPTSTDWKMAGSGGFRSVSEGVVESFGGPGLLWYAPARFDDFVLTIEWRVMRGDGNSGVFIRCPPLANDPGPAIERGYEVQIDDYGVDHARGATFSRLHITGAIYGLAPVRCVTSRGAALWNEFVITARGSTIEVLLNGEVVSELTNAIRERSGHIGLQAHHEGSNVQFQNLQIRKLDH